MGWFWFLGLRVGWFLVLGWRMNLVLSQARWFEIPLLDEGGCQPCFVFPHKRERKTHRFGLSNVYHLGSWPNCRLYVITWFLRLKKNYIKLVLLKR